MENRIKVKIKQCYDTEENYITNNPVLLAGQLAYTRDKYGEYKIGDGTHSWNELEYVKNYFIGTKAEYTEANDAGLIRPGMIICITDDNDYCNIPVDDEMDENSEHVVLNNTITKYVNTHDLKDNRLASSKCTFDGGIPFAGAKSVSGSLGDFFTESRSGFYTVVMKDSNNTWYNVISSRHRNGADDGNKYGLMIMNAFAENADLIWDKQTANGWRGQRTILDSGNYSNKITAINNQLFTSKGMYVSKQAGIAGTQGYVKFAAIKIKAAYANYPCVFILSGRGRPAPIIVSVHYQSHTSITPDITQFLQIGDTSYNVYIHNEGNGVWSLYAPKNEAYGRIDILNEYYSNDHFEVTHPDVQVTTLPSGYVTAAVGGVAGFANALRDSQNNSTTTAAYSKAGLAYSEYTWLTGWNGYELRAVNKSQYMGEISANGYWGLAPNGDANQWCRTTNQGIIPYQGGNRGGGHQYLGTDTWYFFKSYIDHMFAVDLDLLGNIVSSLTTSTWLNGNKGTAIINSTAAGSGYNCLFKMNSPNGVFTASSYSGEFGLQYTANSVINANNNSTTKRAVLLNESGNSSFPGQVSAANFSAGGSSAFTTATITNLTVNGSMRLKNSSNYGMKLNFGDGDYVYLYEDVDDHFIIHAGKGIKLDGTVETSYIRNPNAASSGSIYQTNVGALQINSGDIQLGVYNGSNKSFKSDIDIQMEFMQNYIYPNDNTYLLGGSSNRWQQIYAVTSGIITSDKREKKEISYISSESEFDETKMDKEKFLEFMTGIKPVIFKRIDGTNNRPHHGIIAQDFEELLQELGIDHAAFIKSPETEKIEEKDENGNIINAYEKPKENCDYRYGMRYEELVSDNIKFSQITYEEVQELKEENTMLKENLSALEKKVSLLLNNL